MNTTTNANTIYFDGMCGLCSAGERRLAKWLRPRGYRFIPLQEPEAVALFGAAPEETSGEIKLRTADGRTLGGADALVEISRSVWWAWPVYAIARLPGVMPALRAAYRVIARNRMGVSRACGLKPKLVTGSKNFSGDASVSTEMTDTRRAGIAPWWFVALPLAAIAAGPWVQAWAFMWLLAWSVFFAFKLVTWQEIASVTGVTTSRTFAYLFGWPGMDGTFLNDGPSTDRTPVSRATVRVAIGAVLMWIVARLVPADLEILRGWVGLVSTVLVLHFGLFDVLAWFWQRRGIDAQPLMNAPLRARSLAEFWGRRWNRGFHRLAETLVFDRLAKLGPHAAMAATFLASGLVHDLVISFPARGGYGLPTLYFVIQAIGVAVERSKVGRRLGLRRGLRGRAFTIAVVAAPLPLLFHEPFVLRVFLPFMHAIGAL